MKEQEWWRVNIKRKTEKNENESPNGKQQTTLPNPFCLLVTFPFCFVWFSSLYIFFSMCMYRLEERRTTNWCFMENAIALKQLLLLFSINDVNNLANDQIMSITAASIQIRMCLYKPLSFCVFYVVVFFRKRTSSSSSAWTKAISIESCHSNYTGRFSLFLSVCHSCFCSTFSTIVLFVVIARCCLRNKRKNNNFKYRIH